jgi:hypothetical protein
MKAGLVMAVGVLVLHAPLLAQDWSYQAPDPSTDGSPFFYAWTGGPDYPDSNEGNQLTLIRDPHKSSLHPHGVCSFGDCTLKVSLAGKLPQQGQLVTVRFSNGVRSQWNHASGVALIDNYSRAKTGLMNGFYRAMRVSNWVEIGFGGERHRFSLRGSNAAIDQIRPLLRK